MSLFCLVVSPVSLLYRCYSPFMARNIISFHVLYRNGSTFGFDNGSVLVFKNNDLYFKANMCNDIREKIIGLRKNDRLISSVDSSKYNLYKSCL